MANTYTSLSGKIDYSKSFIKLKKTKREILLILKNNKKYDVFKLIGSFNNAFRHNWIKELNEENISRTTYI
jgi:hypothetical protein